MAKVMHAHEHTLHNLVTKFTYTHAHSYTPGAPAAVQEEFPSLSTVASSSNAPAPSAAESIAASLSLRHRPLQKVRCLRCAVTIAVNGHSDLLLFECKPFTTAIDRQLLIHFLCGYTHTCVMILVDSQICCCVSASSGACTLTDTLTISPPGVLPHMLVVYLHVCLTSAYTFSCH